MPRPLVYLGPSAPAEEVLKILPQAVIRPPVRRGDLYRDRLLRFSVFIVIDGVFAQEDAISPREVRDVLDDGAAVLGAASMGALRAVDCRPAGAEGAGLVYRLFRAGVVSSEDEVAVIFHPERPFPAVSVSLIHVRVALHRAERSGLIPKRQAQDLVRAAERMHFSHRSWSTIAKEAGCDPLAANVRRRLECWDPKRFDARVLVARVAERMAQDPTWGAFPRQNRTVFRHTAADRQLEADPLRGDLEEDLCLGFVLWMLASGRLNDVLGGSGRCLKKLQGLVPSRTDASALALAQCLGRRNDTQVDNMATALREAYYELREKLIGYAMFDCEWFRYIALLDIDDRFPVPQRCLQMARLELCTGHHAKSWRDLLRSAGFVKTIVVGAAELLARGKAERLRHFESEGMV